MLKIFETFIGAMKEAGIQPDTGDNYTLPSDFGDLYA